MNIDVGKVGWERVAPLENHPELTCEVKRLSAFEMIDFYESCSTKDGKLELTGKLRREIFAKYIRNIEGMTLGGEPVTDPAQLLGPTVPSSNSIVTFIMGAVGKFIAMAFVSEEERKNSDKPSSTSGSRAAKKDKAG